MGGNVIRNLKSSHNSHLADKIGQHLPPGGPVVAHVLAPQIQPVFDAFAVQDVGEIDGGAGVFVIALAGGNNDFALAHFVQHIFIIPAGQIVRRRVEIDVVVEIPFSVIAQIVNPAHGNSAGENIRAAEKAVGGVQRPHGSAGSDDRNQPFAVVMNERNHLLHHVLVECLVPHPFVVGIHVAIQPAFAVHSIDGKDLAFAALDQRGEHVDHLEALQFQKIRRGGGKNEHRESVMAVHRDRHLLLQAVAPPIVNFSAHAFSPLGEWGSNGCGGNGWRGIGHGV